MFDVSTLTPSMRKRLSAELGMVVSATYHWRQVPPKRVLDVERVLGIPRWVLRPDIYPPQDHPVPRKRVRRPRPRPEAA